MRLVLLTNEFPSPWLPTKGTFNFEMARALAERQEVKVVVPVSWTDELLAARQGIAAPAKRCERRDGMTIHYPRFYYPPKIGRTAYDRFLWWSLRATLKPLLADSRPDVVLGYWAHPDGAVAVRAARSCGAAAWIMVGGSDVLLLTASQRRGAAIRRALAAADGVVAVSQHLRERIVASGLPAECVHVVYRGVDRTRFSPGDRGAARDRLQLPRDMPQLVWVGRMAQVKSVVTLLQATAMLARGGNVFELNLLGDGAERGRLETLAASLGMSSRVRFVGPTPHERLADWYRAADWTVLSSQSEGVPNVLLESHACGTPFVATAVGGVPEIALPGVDRLVPPGDSAAMAAAISDALASAPPDRAMVSSAVQSLSAAADELANCLAGAAPLATGCGGSAGRARMTAVQAPYRKIARHNPLRQLARRGLAAVLPRRYFLVSGPRSSNAISLTFDDGPHPEHTPRVLNVLRDHSVRATFFVVGRHAQEHPDLVRRIVGEGHELGHHSYSHGVPHQTSARQLLDELAATNDLLERIVGFRPRLFRPPHGKLTVAKLLGLWRAGQTVVLWNVDPKDYACQSADELQSRLFEHSIMGGDIVLMHDNRSFATAATPDIAAAVRRAGLGFLTISEALGGSNVKIRAV